MTHQWHNTVVVENIQIPACMNVLSPQKIHTRFSVASFWKRVGTSKPEATVLRKTLGVLPPGWVRVAVPSEGVCVSWGLDHKRWWDGAQDQQVSWCGVNRNTGVPDCLIERGAEPEGKALDSPSIFQPPPVE